MNKKIRSFKKGLLSVCNKIMHNAAVQETARTPEPAVVKPVAAKPVFQALETTPIRFSPVQEQRSSAKSSRRPHRQPRHLYASIKSQTGTTTTTAEQTAPVAVPNGSSGYGTSVTESAMSVFVNLDNYFYDENFAKIRDRAQETSQAMKTNVIQCLLNYQFEFLAELKRGLEHYVRPLGSLIDTALFLRLFQNIEKIYTLTEFVRNTINESMQLTHDIYTSTLTVISEYIGIIAATYETYLKGHARSSALLDNAQFIELLDAFAEQNELARFHAAEFVSLPVQNITKIYCAFVSLLEMTPIAESHDYERISAICQQLKQLIGPSSDVSLQSACSEMLAELFDAERGCQRQSSGSPAAVESSSSESDSAIGGSSVRSVSVAKLNRKLARKSHHAKSSRHARHSKQLRLPAEHTDGLKIYFV